MRTTSKTLFNKNHILLIKYNNKPVEPYRTPIIPGTNNEIATKYILSEELTTSVGNSKSLGWRQRQKIERERRAWRPKYDLVVKESPLGFYYTKQVCINLDEQPKIPMEAYANTSMKTLRKLTIRVDDSTEYVLTYPIRNGDVVLYNGYRNVASEIRPWQLLDGTSMEDHFIFDLFDILNKIFAEAGENDLKMYEERKSYMYDSSNNKWSTTATWREVQMDVYQQMFGDKNGPRFQTNEEKILAAGFDLKTSFRKAKEE